MYRPILTGLVALLIIAGPSLYAQGRGRTSGFPADKPNIVLLIGDDYGYPYFGFQGSKIVKTPVLDKLAREGTVFSFGHSTSSVCKPSLMSLLSGFYPFQIPFIMNKVARVTMAAAGGEEKLTRWQRTMINVDSTRGLVKHLDTLPRLLATAGYASFQTGKYWEGDFADAGFDGGMSGQIGPITGKRYKGIHAINGGDGMMIGRSTMQPIYDFLDKHKGQPFFIWYAPTLPHIPHNPPPEIRAIYQNLDLSESAKNYYAMCTWFDRGVGELIDFLKRRGLSENTLFIYLSDNGWEQEPKQEFEDTYVGKTMGGDKGKMGMHELGFRTPVIFRWSGHVPQGVRDETRMVSIVDLFPTILEVAGIAAPKEAPGKSLGPAVMGSKEPLREVLIGTMDNIRPPHGELPKRAGREGMPASGPERASYLRSKRWHYIHYPERNFDALYDKQSDPSEDTNVAEQHPQLVERFRARIRLWKAGLAEPFLAK